MAKFPYGFWDNPGPDEGWSWIVMIGAVITSMLTLGFSNTGGAGLVYSEIIRVFDVTREEAMWPFSIVYVSHSIAGLSVSFLSSIFSIRLLFIAGSLACSMALILCFWATDVLYITFVFGILFGTGVGLGYSLAGGLVVKYFAKYQGTATAMYSAGAPFGGFVLPWLMNHILSSYDLRSSMLLLGGVTLHMLIVSLLMRSRTPENFIILKNVEQLQQKSISEQQSNAKRTKSYLMKSSLKQYVDILREPMFYVVTFQSLICVHVFASINLTLNDYLSDKDFSRTTIVNLLSAFSISDIVGRLGTGLFSDIANVEPSKISMVAMFIQGVCTFFLCLTTNVVAIFFIISMLGFMEGAANALVNILYCKHIGMNTIYTSISLKGFLIGMLGILRPSIVGSCRDTLGSYDYFYFLLGSCSILSSVLWILHSCMKKKEKYLETTEPKI